MEVLLITGSTRGIGLCLAKYLKDTGKYKLIIHGRKKENIEKAKKELGESDKLYYICEDLLVNSNNVIINTTTILQYHNTTTTYII